MTSNNNRFIYNFHFCKAHMEFCDYKYLNILFIAFFNINIISIMFSNWTDRAVKADEL